MTLQYEGVDVTGDVHIKSAKLIDYAGGLCDRVDLAFVDPGRLWMKWGAKKGDTLRVRESAYDTGTMWVDEIGHEAGVSRIGAVSAPPAIREAAVHTLENIRLSALVADIAARAGLGFALYGQEDDPLYDRLTQDGTPDLAFLALRGALEGRAVKVANGIVTVIYEPWMEARTPVREIDLTENTRFHAHSTSAGICSGCVVRGEYAGAFSVPGKLGPVYLANMEAYGIDHLSGAGEAQRYAKGILRQINRWEHRLDTEIPIDTELAAGCVVTVRLEGAWGGAWVAGALSHDPMKRRTALRLRRPLEGY